MGWEEREERRDSGMKAVNWAFGWEVYGEDLIAHGV